MSGEILENQTRYGGLIDDAQAKIDMATAEWRAAMEEVRRTAAERAAKTDEAREETARAAEGTRQAAGKAGLSADGGDRSSSGSWSLKELSGLLGDSDYEARTANASETSVRLQQETNRYLKRMVSETLTYGG